MDCAACGHPVDPDDPQPCEDGGLCRPICQECGDTLAAEGHGECVDCLEILS